MPDHDTHISKRKLQQGQSKKAMAAAGMRGSGERVVFDDEGNARPLYELQDERTFHRAGDATQQAKAWRDAEAAHMAEADAIDKSRVREKRQEKKRKMKERMREMAGEPEEYSDDGEDPGNGLANLVLPGEEEDREDDDDDHGADTSASSAPSPPPQKRQKQSLAEQEALAMRLLS